MNKILSVLMAVLFLTSFVSCAKKTDGELPEVTDTEASSVDDTTKTQKKEEKTENSSSEFYKTDEKMYEINSVHCSVQFPERWKDMVETQVTETEDTYQITFYALINHNKIPLYTFVFGDTEEGYLLGRVNTEKGEQNVFIIDLFSEYQGGLSEEDELIYFEMSDGVNHIISKLVYDNGMIIT